MSIVQQDQEVTLALVFINEQIAFHEKRAAKMPERDFRHQMHVDTAEKFKHLAKVVADLQSASQEKRRASKPPSGQQLLLSLEDVSGLPEELLAELSISTSDWQEFDIITLVEAAGGIQTLDKIIIGLYKKTGEIHKRTVVNNRINRMMGKGLIFGVPNRKGVYTTKEMSSLEIEALNKTEGAA